MIAKQTVYLTGDRSKVVPEGDKDARFLLVREGHEINEALVEQHDALDLVNSAFKGDRPKAQPSELEEMPERPKKAKR